MAELIEMLFGLRTLLPMKHVLDGAQILYVKGQLLGETTYPGWVYPMTLCRVMC